HIAPPQQGLRAGGAFVPVPVVVQQRQGMPQPDSAEIRGRRYVIIDDPAAGPRGQLTVECDGQRTGRRHEQGHPASDLSQVALEEVNEARLSYAVTGER